MAFADSLLDEIRSRVALSDLIGRRVRLVRRGREHSGLCPFHKERTPSFTVNDDKGFYHCFGCGAHGSLFDFVMQSEGLSFPEAVERLAAQAGVALPRRDQAGGDAPPTRRQGRAASGSASRRHRAVVCDRRFGRRGSTRRSRSKPVCSVHRAATAIRPMIGFAAG